MCNVRQHLLGHIVPNSDLPVLEVGGGPLVSGLQHNCLPMHQLFLLYYGNPTLYSRNDRMLFVWTYMCICSHASVLCLCLSRGRKLVTLIISLIKWPLTHKSFCHSKILLTFKMLWDSLLLLLQQTLYLSGIFLEWGVKPFLYNGLNSINEACCGPELM